MAFSAWDPIESSANIAFSNGDLTATKFDPNSELGTLKADTPLGPGKTYWEYYYDGFIDVGYYGIGGPAIDVPAQASSYQFQFHADAYSYRWNTGQKRHGGTLAAFGDPWDTLDILGCAYDGATGSLWFSVNGVWQASGNPATGANPAFTGIPVGYFPMALIPFNFIDTDPFRYSHVNFGSSAFNYTPPSGFSGLVVPNPPVTIAIPAVPLTITPQVPTFLIGYVDYISEKKADPRQSFFYQLTLTGENDALPDIILPLANFQARRRDSKPSYLSVVVPDAVGFAADISSRGNGELVISRGVVQDGIVIQLNEIARSLFDSIRSDEGGRSSSSTLSGHKTVTALEPKTRTLTGSSYRSASNGVRRYRCAPDNFLEPGDTADINGENIVVESITWVVTPTLESMEIQEVSG